MPARRPLLNDHLLHTAPASLTQPEMDMQYATLEARIASFAPPTKRSKAGWPHKSPSPADLAMAGFFYKPTSSKDNCQCFMCDRQLDGWEAEDDALNEHMKHGSDCAWALLMSIQQVREYDTSNVEDPTGPHLTDARQYTFESMGWPHQGKRGWTCKIEKMVEAGWYYAPTPECDDYTSCTYCKLSLDGWERKDDPWDNHYRRSPDCPFFAFAGTTVPSKRPKAKRGRSSKASSRVSTQSNTTTISQMDESTGNFEVLGVDTTLEETIDKEVLDHSIVSIQSTTSTATTKAKRKAPARGKGAAAAKKSKITRARAKRSEPESDMEIDGEMEMDTQPTQDTEVRDPLKKSKAKKQKGKQKLPSPTPEPDLQPELGPESYPEADDDILAIAVPVEPPEVIYEQVPERKLSKGKTKIPESETEPDHAEGIEQQEPDDSKSLYPFIPHETPDDFQDALEQRQSGNHKSPQPDDAATGPPEKEDTPIPVKQISPLKEQRRLPRRTITPPYTDRVSGKTRSSAKVDESPSIHHMATRSPSQPSDIENLPPSSRPAKVRPPLSSPGAPPPVWTPVKAEVIFRIQQGHEADIFKGAMNASLTQVERDMTVQQWVEHVAAQAESRLSAEGELIVSLFETEGRRAMAALEDIQCT